MEGKLLEELNEIKSSHDVEHVNYFNDGSITTDSKSFAKLLDNFESRYTNNEVLKYLKSAVHSFAYSYKFDSVDVHLLVGIIFTKENVDKDNIFKDNAQPLNGIVRYYTTETNCFLDGKKMNKYDYAETLNGIQGYMNYEDFIASMREAGLDFDGPETFLQLKYAILHRDPFDICISADLNKKIEEEPQKDTVKEKVMSLTKKRD